MCGILFIHNREIEQPVLRERLQRALAMLAHRGPDESGTWFGNPVGVGHTRLSILDLLASRQPMTDPGERYVLTYNGEIYNYQALRRELENKWSFTTQGDTEVLLAGLITRGESFLQSLEGMWAFALWDRRTETLLLARDRMGKKPLFYNLSGERMTCASELPALATLEDCRWQEDLDSTADYLRYGYYLPGTTAYQNVREVLPGHVLRWRPGTEPQQQAYWSLDIGGFQGSKQQAQEALRERLINAVSARMVADVEVGAFLSGGIDSSLVVGILCRELGIKPKTFTIGFSEDSYDERQFARRIADFYATEHYEEVLAECDSDNLKVLILKHIGQPFADSSLLPTSLLARMTSRHVKVALSGDGADELFSGYQRYQGRALLRWYFRMPKFMQRRIERSIEALPEPMVHHSRSLLKKAHLFYDLIKRQESEMPYIAPVNYARHVFARLAPSISERGHSPPLIPAAAKADSILEMMAADAAVYLPQDILVKVDRATMASSLEARAPFLDTKVVELAFSLPRTWHRRGYSGKHMLRESFGELLPAATWKRRKQGFGVPIDKWFRSKLGDELRELLRRQKDHPFDTSEVLFMLDDHCLGQRDRGYRLWNIYVYLFWKEHTAWL